MRRVLAVLALALCAGAVTSAVTPAEAASPVRYQVVDLGTFDGELANAFGVNDKGEAVGRAEIPSTATKGFLWRRGELIDIGGLSDSGTGTTAYELNNRSEVVGASFAPDPQFGGRTAVPFYWSQGTGMIMIGNDFTHSGFGRSRDINDHGLVVGQWRNRAFTWSKTAGYAELPLLPDAFFQQSEAMAVNNNGVAVGRSIDETAFPKPVRWRNGAVEQLAMPDGGRVGVANDVNSSGLIVGEADKAIGGGRLTHPVMWTPGGTLEEIPLVKSDPPLDMGFAEGVNDRGDDIIGWDMSSAFGDGRQVGWVRDAHGRLTTLNDVIDPAAGWDIRIPLDINSKGQIVGIGVLTVDGVTYPGRAFLMTPAPA